MKKISLIGGAIIAFLGLTALNVKSPEKMATESNISFYQTHLVCGAAPDIGCGTRAKPILKKFMEHDAVEKAWLNHAGTVIAVEWKQAQKVNQSEIANSTFASFNQPYLMLTGNDYKEQLADFESGKWYKGGEVDQLSMIEAGRIADQIMSSIDAKLDASSQVKEILRGAFENYIKEEFLKIENATVINEIGYWKRWEKDLTAIGKEYLGEQMPEIQIVSSSGECKLENSSCTKDSKSSCCKKGS